MERQSSEEEEELASGVRDLARWSWGWLVSFLEGIVEVVVVVADDEIEDEADEDEDEAEEVE